MLLGCIEWMRCRLLLPMFAVSVCLSVRQSRGSTRLHCAETAERIKILFEDEVLYWRKVSPEPHPKSASAINYAYIQYQISYKFQR